MPPGRSIRVAGLVCLGHFFSHFYYLLPLTLLPILKSELGVTYTALGAALACYGITTSLMQVPVGFLVDRFGAPLILVGGLVLSSLAMISLGLLMTGYIQFVLVILMTGLGDSVFHPANYSILARSIEPAYAGRAYSAHNFSGQLGFAASPFLTGILAAHVGWRPAVVTFGMAGLCAAAFLLSRRKVLSTASTSHMLETQRGTGGRTGWRLLLSRPILLCLVVFTALGLMNGGMRDFGVTALQLIYSESTAKVGSIVSIFLFASLFGILLGGWLADRTHRHRLTAAGSLTIIAVALPVITFAKPSLAVLGAGFALLGLFSGIIVASRDLLVRSLTPAHEAGKTFGFVSIGISLASLIAPFLYGILLDHTAPVSVLYVAAVLSAVTVVLVLIGEPSRSALRNA